MPFGFGFIAPYGSTASGGFSPYSTNYLTVGTYTVPIPAGATYCQIDGYGPGQRGNGLGGNRGGAGGAWARRTVTVAGHTAIYIVVPAASTAQGTVGDSAEAYWDDLSGTLLMRAVAAQAISANGVTHLGGLAANCIGDTAHSGGNTDYAAGAGGAGPDGDGGDATNNTTGVGLGGGGLAGDGGVGGDGSSAGSGQQCGGGGGRTLGGAAGGAGGVQLFWT